MKLSTSVRVELPYASINIKKEGIIHLHYKNHALTLEENKNIFKILRENSRWEVCPFLISGDEFSSHDKDSKMFNSSPDVVKHCSCLAFITKNLAQKLVVNFFVRVYKPKVPTRLFTDQDKAFEWLLKFNKEAKKNSLPTLL